MNYWIGIIGSKLTHQRFLDESDSWFCMPSTSEIGDYVLMYASKKSAGVKGGVFAVYQIFNKDESKDGDCRRFGIFSGSGDRPIYVDLKLLDKFQKTISFQAIKAHNYLSTFSYVRRNFQATYFKISEKEYKAFIALASKLNE